MTSTLEEVTGKLFGGLWTSLNDQQYRESVELFTKRAIANNFDLDWLKGKKCLDAGCGSGRYSVAMALHGAASVTAVDVSDTGLAEASRRASEFPSITFQKASVLDLPFEDSTFDFVWSAGVIHHTSDFDKALSELTRVLKPRGKLFLLVYGAGGLRWKAVQALRPVVVDLGMKLIDDAIGIAGLPANNRKHLWTTFLFLSKSSQASLNWHPSCQSLGAWILIDGLARPSTMKVIRSLSLKTFKNSSALPAQALAWQKLKPKSI